MVSVVPWMNPVSSVGMNPLGTSRNSPTVPTRIAAENASAVRRWSMTQPSVRS